ncbi:GFA family protein [Amorphus sp. 3PC139-8]|uniref:GFA family protein n=1 Tax=Amorphus sp. 3PC139-8 TaxID=2735676 RepID=UPI00345DED00
MSNEPVRDGGCRCGAVRFRTTGPEIITMACHCTGCQRMTASAFSLSALFARSAFELLQGETVIGGQHGVHRHHHCGHCLSWLYTLPDGLDEFINLRATMFDDTEWIAPFVETCTSEKLAWVTTPARFSFEQFPPMESFGDLISAYADARA